MSDARRGPGLGPTLLVGGILLLTAGGVAVAFVPATECPALTSIVEKTVAGRTNPTQIEALRKCRTRGHQRKPCAVCGSSCRVPFLKGWLSKKS